MRFGLFLSFMPAGRQAGTHAGRQARTQAPRAVGGSPLGKKTAKLITERLQMRARSRSLCVPYIYKATHHWDRNAIFPLLPLLLLLSSALVVDIKHITTRNCNNRQNKPLQGNHTTPLHLGVRSFYLVPLAPVGATVSSVLVR